MKVVVAEIRVVELAKKLGVHRNTIRNWIKKGVLKAIPTVGKKYLVRKEDFLDFRQSQGIAEDIDLPWARKDLRLPPPSEPSRVDSNTKPVNPNPEREAPMQTQPVGSVMVVGGGIAGIQATLDLAESGYRVYLVEKSPGIGGVMAQLDKTFPTNDCAM